MCLFQWSQWCSQGQPSTPGVQSKQQINWICFRQIERSHGITSTLFTWKILLLRFILFGWSSVLPWSHSTLIVFQVFFMYLLGQNLYQRGLSKLEQHGSNYIHTTYNMSHMIIHLPFKQDLKWLCKYTCKLLSFYPQIRQEPYIKSSVIISQ